MGGCQSSKLGRNDVAKKAKLIKKEGLSEKDLEFLSQQTHLSKDELQKWFLEFKALSPDLELSKVTLFVHSAFDEKSAHDMKLHGGVREVCASFEADRAERRLHQHVRLSYLRRGQQRVDHFQRVPGRLRHTDQWRSAHSAQLLLRDVRRQQQRVLGQGRVHTGHRGHVHVARQPAQEPAIGRATRRRDHQEGRPVARWTGQQGGVC